MLGELNYTYDILVFPRHLKAVKKFIAALPPMRLVIDHIAKPKIGEQEIEEWAQDMFDIAQNQHVYCKLSGMVTETNPGWKEGDFQPYMDVIFELFGEDRVMFGSDWPVCLLNGDYKKVYDIAYNFTTKWSKTATDKVFSKNALSFYKNRDGAEEEEMPKLPSLIKFFSKK